MVGQSLEINSKPLFY